MKLLAMLKFSEMLRLRHNKLVLAMITIGLSSTLMGCTQEKAQALLMSVRAFASSSSDALDSYETLFKEYTSLKLSSPEEKFIGAYAAIGKYGATQFTASFPAAAQSVSERKLLNPGENTVMTTFEDLRKSYNILSDSYASLPQGSLLGARYVPCGQLVVSKLTLQLVNFANDIDKSPLYPIQARNSFESFVEAAAKGDREKAKQKYDSFYSQILNYENKHAEAKKKTIIAVEQGRRLYKLLGSYSSMNLANILMVVDSGFMATINLKGANLGTTTQQLALIQREMDNSDAWKRVKQISLGSISVCPTNPI